MILALLFGVIVGLALGLTGGGGSIFAVPLLIHGLGYDLRRAVAMSLAVVGLTALFGALLQARQGRVLWKAGALLGAGGMIAAPFGAMAGAAMPETTGLYLFSALMAIVGIFMIRKPNNGTDVPLEWIACRRDPANPPRFTWLCAVKVTGTGVATGALSGAFGVGGGFLVVPALLVVLRVEMGVALATSLVAIFLVSTSGFAANARFMETGDWETGAGFLLGAAVGMASGILLKTRLPGEVLKKTFGWAVIGTAVFMAIQTGWAG